MTLGAYYQSAPIAKPEPRCVTKARKVKADAKAERAAREIVRKRDQGRCRVPSCRERAVHLHHIVYRSKSKGRRWDPCNLVSLCVDCHRAVHAGLVTIRGNADRALTIEVDYE